jgi:hypothetical protein
MSGRAPNPSRVPIFQVDAFAARRFTGNPAAVMVLQGFPDDAALLALAAENNLSETAFLVREGDGYLLLANAEWGEAEPSAAVKASAVRIGLEADDVSPWLDEPAAMLGGQTPLPVGATFADAAAVYLWYWDTLRAGQQHGWRERLALP